MSWTLHHGDCLDPLTGLASLADKSVDHVICDPPYEVEAHTNARRRRAGVMREHAIDFGQITEQQREDTARQAVRISRGWVLFFCQVEAVARWRSALESAGASWRRAMVWIKPNGTPQFTGDRPAQGYECISASWAGAGRSRWHGGGGRGVYTFNVNNFGRLTDGRPHPTQKPVALMSALVRDFTDAGDLILDPYAGSGTTGVAALAAGRRFVGWERDEKYHAAAVKRLEGTRQQLDLTERAAKPKQRSLLGPEAA